MWAPILTTALGGAQWLLDRKRQRRAEESVPVQLMTDGYFQAMAEDIQSRVGEGADLKVALREVYKEQGPVLLRPAPQKSLNKGLVVAASVGALLALGLLYRRRR